MPPGDTVCTIVPGPLASHSLCGQRGTKLHAPAFPPPGFMCTNLTELHGLLNRLDQGQNSNLGSKCPSIQADTPFTQTEGHVRFTRFHEPQNASAPRSGQNRCHARLRPALNGRWRQAHALTTGVKAHAGIRNQDQPHDASYAILRWGRR